MLRALGFVPSGDPLLNNDGTITITAGSNVTLNFSMTTAFEIKNETQLDTAIGAANTSSKEEIFMIGNDFSISTSPMYNIGPGQNVTIITDGGDRKITRNGASGDMITVGMGTLNLGKVGSGGKLTIDGGGAASSGSIVHSAGTLTMNDGVVLTNNVTSMPNGGGVFINNGSFTMNGGEIKNNKINSSGGGGGVYIAGGGSFTMYGGKITGNEVTAMSGDANGGGVYIASGANPFVMSGGVIENNRAISNGGGSTLAFGGGVYTAVGFTMRDNARISGNGAINYSPSSSDKSFGGGVGVDNGDFYMLGGSIDKNFAEVKDLGAAYGGGLSVGSGLLATMSGGVIKENHAIGSASPSGSAVGGGVYTESSFSMSNNAQVLLNTAEGYSSAQGGGISLAASGALNMANDAKISGNIVNGGTSAAQGGGVYCTASNSINLSCTAPCITDNDAIASVPTNASGGGVILNGATTTPAGLVGGFVTGNRSTGSYQDIAP